jgi:hypothetical protein
MNHAYLSVPQCRFLGSTPRERQAALTAIVLCVIWGVPLLGCGRAGPPVQVVQGTVTLDGQQIEGVAVTFTPVASGAGIQAFGTTQADGSYSLSAFRGAKPGSGTVIGEYRVTCTKVIGGDLPAEVPPPPYDAPAAEHEAWRKEEAKRQRAKPTPVQYLVPKAYGDPETSGLKVTVKKGSNTGPEFRFDLKSDVK